MIELDERDVRLIRRLEESNYKNYDVVCIKDKYYISKENLLIALDDTQDCRNYAEEKLQTFIEEVESKQEDETPGLLKSYQSECERLKQENIELSTKLEFIHTTLSEDDYEKLAKEGVELFE